MQELLRVEVRNGVRQSLVGHSKREQAEQNSGRGVWVVVEAVLLPYLVVFSHHAARDVAKLVVACGSGAASH